MAPRAVFAALLLLTALSSRAQRESVTQSVQWFVLASNLQVSNKATILLDGQFRFVNGFEPMQFQTRTGLDFKLTTRFSFMPLGYVYVWNPIYGKQPATYSNNEHRLFEQVTYDHSIGRLQLNHRLRLEQRFLQVHANENGEVVNKGYDLYVNRIRYKLSLKYPFGNRELTPGTWYGAFYEEIFLDFGKNVVYHDPDQNRFYVAVGYKLNKKTEIQAGYFNQLLIKLSGDKQEVNIGFKVQVFSRIDLRKSED